MASRFLIDAIQRVARRFGYEIHRLPDRQPPMKRPVGDMTCFLEDIARRGFQPRLILDVGANKGDWCRMAASAFPQASFILVEPQPEMVPELDAFCREHRQTRRIEAAAGAKEGELTLTVWDDLMGSSLLPAENSPEAQGKKRRSVKVITLDSLFDDASPLPDVAKLDIQGFELEALRGATRLFGHTELFILEVSLYACMAGQPVTSEIVAFMAERGYEVYDIPGFMRRPLDAALAQVDLAFARRSGTLRASNAWS